MNSKESLIHLALAFDQNFLTPFYVLATSVFENNQQHAFCLHVIAAGIPAQEKQRISQWVQQQGSSIQFYDIRQSDLDALQLPTSDPRYTQANFYRLFFPMLVSKDVKKLLYLDTDIVVVGDLGQLFHLPLQEVPFAAVVDPLPRIRTDLGITEPGQYFNSGVLLLNLDLWRQQRISEKALAFAAQFPEKCIYVDQCALNAVSLGNWLKLDPKFNLMGQYVPILQKKYYASFLRDKVVIHYNIRKPWDRLCQMRLKHLYFQYLQQSPQASKTAYKKLDITLMNMARLCRNKFVEFYYNYLISSKGV